MDDKVKAFIRIASVVLFLIPFTIFTFCAWWHLGGIAYEVMFNDREPTTVNMFQLVWLGMMTCFMSSFSRK